MTTKCHYHESPLPPGKMCLVCHEGMPTGPVSNIDKYDALATAVRAHLDSLPRCGHTGCDRRATGYLELHGVIEVCEEHARPYGGAYTRAWQDTAEALAKLVAL